jgi:aldose 1-epimerase
MKPHISARTLPSLALPALLLALLLASMAASFPPAARAQAATVINGQKVVLLTCAVTDAKRPEFTSVTVMPGRGMQILQITANWPGKGNIDVLYAPSLAKAANLLNNHDDANGDRSPSFGFALLIPYPNRIRGKLSADHKTITAEWEGHALVLPANDKGKLPGAPLDSIHGLIHKDKTSDIQVKKTSGGEQVTGVIHAGSFGGHWLSKTDLYVTICLTAEAVDVSVEARNVGKEAEPIAIGAHPYFKLPSGEHAQARVHVPGTMRAEIDNYDSVYPTGKLEPVAGTRFDMLAPGGRAIDHYYYDDNWSHLLWKDGAATAKVIDPAAHYGVEVSALSPQIETIQMYSPPTAKFVAIEPQFNFVDPFGKEWGSMKTGMVTLKPGESTDWHIRFHLFVP